MPTVKTVVTGPSRGSSAACWSMAFKNCRTAHTKTDNMTFIVRRNERCETCLQFSSVVIHDHVVGGKDSHTMHSGTLLSARKFRESLNIVRVSKSAVRRGVSWRDFNAGSLRRVYHLQPAPLAQSPVIKWLQTTS
jgi:hypothetical protein